MSYYLRKEPRRHIADVPMPDGKVIHHDYMTTDVALYKATDVPRFYRQQYGNPAKYGNPTKCMKLYVVKKLSTILFQRQLLFDYCGDWFDVYNEFGKVEIEEDKYGGKTTHKEDTDGVE